MNTNRIFNPETDMLTPDGEVIPNGKLETGITVIQSKDSLAALMDQVNVPIHIKKMQELKITPEMMASYVNVPWVDVLAYMGKVVKVIGAAVWFSGEFNPQKDPDNTYSGYHKMLFKLEETRKVTGVPIGERAVSIDQHVIIQTSAKKVAEMGLVYLTQHGWFDWPEGTYEYILFGGTKEAGYLAQPVNELVAKIQGEHK